MVKRGILYKLVNVFAVLTIVGFWGMHSILFTFFGGGTTLASVTYRGIQLVLSIIIVVWCFNDIKHSLRIGYYFLLLTIMILYTLRMIFDKYWGPFVSALPPGVFTNDILYIAVSIFTGAYGMIAGYKYLDVKFISKLVFYLGLLSVTLLLLSLYQKGNLMAFEDDRLDLGGGLGTLALVKLGAVTFLAGFHMFFNRLGNRVIILLGMAMSTFLMLASGSRGGLVALVITMMIFVIVHNRKNLFLTISGAIILLIIIINLVPILMWLSGYFPVIGERLLLTVVDGDEGNRDILRDRVYALILNNPIFGYSYRMNTDITGYTTHNGILDVTLALGIPMGVIYVIVFYFKLGIKAISKLQNLEMLLPASMVVFTIVASFSGASITDNIYIFSVCLFVSCLYSPQMDKTLAHKINLEQSV